MSEQSLEELVGDPAVVREVFDRLPFLAMYMAGPELRIEATNGATRAFTGRDRLVGLTMAEAMPDLANQHYQELYTEALRTGQPQSLREWRAQFDPPGGGGPVEVYIDIDIVPRRDETGAVAGLIVTGADATARVRERSAAQAHADSAERRVADAMAAVEALQRELLPPGVPVVPGVEMAASYLLADADTAAGGDWFDATPLPDGRVALVVGDVVGHGVAASAVMGQLRVLVGDRLAETGDVAAALEAADRFAHHVRGARSATVCVVVLDPVTGGVEYATAGHPPPLVVGANGGTRFLDPTGGGPLASGVECPLVHDRVHPGDLVLLYTDGILERPGRDLAGASVELAQVAADVTAGRVLPSAESTTAERVATQTLEVLTRKTGHGDDITLLAARLVPDVPDLAISTIALPHAIDDVRARLQEWVQAHHLAADDALALQHAVGELVTNVVDHAYAEARRRAEPPGPVRLRASLARTGLVHVVVGDEGRWTEPVAGGERRGRGLWMVAQLVDDLVLDHPDGATEAYLVHRTTRPARLLTSNTRFVQGPRAPVDARQPLAIEAHSPELLSISGPLDATTASRVAAAITRASAAGTLPLVLDLTGVTHLASAGVTVLYDAETRALGNGIDLTIRAAAGSVADQVLTLVALHHITDLPPLHAHPA